ncbi:uncharacterized protein N7498_000344 [Penicillium cinerascens]|uniref:Uncharacterized protein n=1 Tax=Penicillium cinerascens TaxID=70096 RepID=A0A9W9NE79_9EURO|nr:uncharacterized protein N7498_000344 [Penicillium cinerascens]KAJ5218245.1 hypothetical protein N7498_000344 [Penicillium cinerascens]
MDESSVIIQANSLLQELISAHDEKYHIGTVVSGIYDTAWISMVLKKPNPSTAQEWAFPACFDFLLQNQAEDGGWGHEHSLVERVTCTLVSLLSILRHLGVSEGASVKDQVDLQYQADKAIQFVKSSLPNWELASLDTGIPIGLELWLPVVIEKLEEEGVSFDIPGKDRVIRLRLENLSRFPVEVLYRPSGLFQPSPLFTLEGLIGIIDFGKLRHQTVFGSMFSSPSSTAVYLMESPDWDPASEAYLNHVVEHSIIKHNRAVPGMFPTSVFDIDWVLNIFVEGGFNLNKLDANAVKVLGNMILQRLEKQDGIIGSDLLICPDSDSTAMALKTVYHSPGTRLSAQNMINAFEGEKNYFTYSGERDPSISSNAHVLQALVLDSAAMKHTASIEKCARYLCETWRNANKLVRDKWRVEPLSETLLKTLIPLTLFQAVLRILLTQNPNGSWGQTSLRENTSLAVITLKSTWSLPFVSATLSQVMDQAIKEGQAFISANMDAPFNDYSWNGKCAYGLLSISRAAALSALLGTRPAREYSKDVKSLFHIEMGLIAKQAKLLGFYFEGNSKITTFEERNGFDEGFSMRLAVICITLNYHKKYFLSNRFIYGMLELMHFVYHIDNLIDTDLSDRSPDTLQLIEDSLHQMFAFGDISIFRNENGMSESILGYQGKTIAMKTPPCSPG